MKAWQEWHKLVIFVYKLTSIHSILYSLFSILSVVILFSILYSLFSVSPALAAKIGAPPNYLTFNSGLVGYWTFDGKDMVNNVADKSGQGNNGALQFGTLGYTSTSSMSVAGKLGQGLMFDGVDDAIKVNSNFIGINPLTVCSWIYKKGVGGGNYGRILDNGATVFFNNNVSGLAFSRDNGLHLATSAADASPLNIWKHICVTSASNIVNFYANGVISGTPNQDIVSTQAGSNVTIGNNSVYERSFNGLFDDLRIYSRALSANEVAQLYKVGAAKVGKSPDYGPAAATTVKPNLTSGLVGYWTFDGKDTPWTSATAATTLDKSGNYATGTLTNMNRATSTVAGKIGQGLNFDGVNDYVKTSSFSLSGSVITFSSWVKSSIGDYQTIFSSSPQSGTVGYIWLYRVSGSDSLAWQYADGAVYQTATASGFFTGYNNVFVHITVVCDYSNKKTYFYRNGALFTTIDMGGTPVFPSANIAKYIGMYRSENQHPFRGPIDDVRVYNRALSAAEIAQLYQLGAIKVAKSTATNNLASGLVGYWTFDGKDMYQNVADKSGLGNNGALQFGTSGNTSTSSMQVAGKLGQGLKFDGADDYVNINKNVSLQGQARATISAWIKLKASPPSTLNTIYSETTSTYYSRCTLGIDSGGKVDFIIRDSDADPSGTRFDVYSNTVLKANIWYYITAVFDSVADSHKIYINGVLGNTDTTARSAFGTSVTTNIEIGNLDVNSYYFTGSLDDVRVYNRALSAAEVRQLYNLGR